MVQGPSVAFSLLDFVISEAGGGNKLVLVSCLSDNSSRSLISKALFG